MFNVLRAKVDSYLQVHYSKLDADIDALSWE